MPTSPKTTNAPSEHEDPVAVEVIITGLPKVPVPHTFKLPPIPAPPFGTANAPFLHVVLCVGSRMISGPVKLMPPVAVIAPQTFRLPIMPTPPSITSAPSSHAKLSVVLVIVTGPSNILAPVTVKLLKIPVLAMIMPFTHTLQNCAELVGQDAFRKLP